MSTDASAERNSDLSGRSSNKDAREWIERQLRWERVLGTLRDQGERPVAQAA